jgi:hypothetical protein
MQIYCKESLQLILPIPEKLIAMKKEAPEKGSSSMPITGPACLIPA